MRCSPSVALLVTTCVAGLTNSACSTASSDHSGAGLPVVPTSTSSTSQTLTLTGLVRETAPTDRTPIAGVSIEATDGRGVLRQATSDADGRFRVDVSPGPAAVLFSANGYQSLRRSFDVFDAADVSIGLMPEFQYIQETFEKNRSATSFPDLTFSLDVHHAGRVNTMGWFCPSNCVASTFGLMCIDLLDAGGRVLAHTQGTPDSYPGVGADVGGGQTYRFNFYLCSLQGQRFSDSEILSYNLTFSHPK